MKEESLTDKNQQGLKDNTKLESDSSTLTKKQIFEAFEGKIAKSAIQRIDGEWQIVGKFYRVSRLGNSWDVFVCNPSDLYNGLSQRKVSNIVEKLGKFPVNRGFTVLNGEAFSQDVPRETILKCLFILGIRKSRLISPEQKAALTERLKKVRRAA